MRPFLLWGMSARVEWRGANAVPPAYRPTFYRCKRLTHLPQGPARVFWRSVYRSDLSKEATWSRKQEVPALDEIFDNPGLTPLMNLPRRVRFKDFINYSDEKAIFVGLNFAIVSLFFSPWRSSNIMFISWSLLVMNMSLFGHFPWWMLLSRIFSFLGLPVFLNLIIWVGKVIKCHLNFKWIKSTELEHFENLKRGVLKQHPRDELMR